MKLNTTKVRETGGLELLAKQLVNGFMIGLHKSPYHGFSVEFAEHRLFNEGQSTRHIDWKVYARTDRLYTKQYEEETNLRCLLVFDCSSSMYYPNKNSKLEFSLHAGASLAWLLHKQRDAVGIALFSDRIEELTLMKSSGSHLNKLFALLEHKLDHPAKRHCTNVATVLHEIAEKIHTRSLVILFTDMFDSDENQEELFKSLQHLKHCKHEVLLFHVTDHQTERNFDFDDKPYEFIDLETDERVSIMPAEIKSSLQERLIKFHQEIKLRCQQLKIEFIEADSNGGYFHVLQAYLIKRSRMS